MGKLLRYKALRPNRDIHRQLAVRLAVGKLLRCKALRPNRQIRRQLGEECRPPPCYEVRGQGRTDLQTVLFAGRFATPSYEEAVCPRTIAATFPGAQTERLGGAGPVRSLLGGKDLTGRFV